MIESLLIVGALAVAFGNGANDNFKGFATVWGSATLSYRQALTLATIATVAGSLASLWLAQGLVHSFSGKGLVADQIVQLPAFMAGVAGGTALTVLLATRLGLPVSTTHALIGGLIGAGWSHSADSVHWMPLAQAFLMPLLVSPVLAASLSWVTARATKTTASATNCACVIPPQSSALAQDQGTLVVHTAMPTLVVASEATCADLNPVVKLPVTVWGDRLHVLSAMSICFARGVNDTPKLVALLMAAHVMHVALSTTAIAGVMALGGLLFAREVARTMSERVAQIGHREGLIANVITACLVLFASKLGVPVSTTHVSVGAIAGVGASGDTLDRTALRNILLSWVATLPLAAGMAFFLMRLM